jgi:hypothetical protein
MLNTYVVMIHKGSYTGGRKVSISNERGLTEKFVIVAFARIELCLRKDAMVMVGPDCYDVLPCSDS